MIGRKSISITADQLPGEVGAVVRACDLPDRTLGQDWLIENLWAEEGVGIVGGPPKGMKTWIALETSVAVASGTPFLGVYGVRQSGPVLAYFAEDSEFNIKARLQYLCAGRGIDLKTLDLFLVRRNRLLLDKPRDYRWLEDQVQAHKPRLLVLDPFVRMFAGNEDDAGQVSKVMGLLRKLQRDHHVAVMLVHHAKKGVVATGGSSLRGSGDLHAWGDSNVYVSPNKTGSTLTVEHRSARAPEPFRVTLNLDENGQVRGLGVVNEPAEAQPEEKTSLEVRIEQLLHEQGALGLHAIRTSLGVGATKLSETLKNMVAEEVLVHEDRQYRLRTVPPPVL